MTTINEADVESAALEWLAGIGWQTAHGPDIAPGIEGAERDALLAKLALWETEEIEVYVGVPD